MNKLSNSVSLCLLSMTLCAGERIVLENGAMRLTLEPDARASSLIHKPTGRECLARGVRIPAFSLTQHRPYNNELQLALPARSTVFPADAVRREGDTLLVSFSAVGYEAAIKVDIKDSYIGLTLDKLTYADTLKYGDTTATPVDELCVLQLPLRPLDNHGQWLNALWDEKTAVALIATDPFGKIDGIAQHKHFLFSASAVNEVRLEGTGAALIAADTDMLLDAVADVETDYDLPRGVESRRRPAYRWSYYATWGAPLSEIPRHIEFAKQAGFKTMLLSYSAFTGSAGHFTIKKDLKNGLDDVKAAVDKIIAAGLIPGLHFHYNKASKNDPYVTGRPDPRLNRTQTLTLNAPLRPDDTVVEVDENPCGAPLLKPDRRFLRIGNELVAYESYTTSPPYRFMGCQRGQLKTQAVAHEAGFKIGVLDVDTWPKFVRFDQRTSIQDEVAERLGKIYSYCGFQFVYFDGAEDVHPPYWFNVSWAQQRVRRHLRPAPQFAEGACKSHFSWHILTRGNAFDVFKPEDQKNATREHPMAEASKVALDFTSINFGWLRYDAPSKTTMGTQPDILEYVSSRALAWDCPISLNGHRLKNLDAHPRTPDNLEALRRWEELRVNGTLTPEQKETLRDPDQEHHALLDAEGNIEIVPFDQIHEAACGSAAVRAFVFERKRKVYVVYWHPYGEGTLEVALPPERAALMDQFGKPEAPPKENGKLTLPLDKLRYLEVRGMRKRKVVEAFREARVSTR
ncbi:MAG: hypothetical protein PHG96_06445 [Kiritimatiellae bacterium]|nr:hypothetical protein [Kiritimatiellia bacterium]